MWKFVLYQKTPPFMGELSNEVRLRGTSRGTCQLRVIPLSTAHYIRSHNAGWNMVVLLRCRLQYSLFRPILPSLHRPLGALGSNPP